jgi:hypothetical protein
MIGKRRRFSPWRMSLSANRIPLRRDMRYSLRQRWRAESAAAPGHHPRPILQGAATIHSAHVDLSQRAEATLGGRF